MAQATLPISAILREKSLDVEKKKSREDWRKAKELEEARKAGTAPAAVDEEGRDINPHIPQYISAAPWYYNTKGPTLKHQRPQSEEETNKPRTEEWYKRGLTTSIATKFRKGACENCGAITHKRKDCLERPRKVGARFGGGRILADEAVQPNLDLDFESKRDRWNGYDASEHVKVVQEFADVEDMKRRLKAEKLKKEMLEGAGEDSDDEAGEDEDKYVDDIDMPGTKVDSKQRITVRNLRIREDTAKYLRNLDPNSAYYDPKTRSMRDNPYKEAARDPTEVDYAGENFVRYSGDTMEHARAQMFAWEAHEKGVDVHNLADPTKLELLHKEFQKKKDQFKTEIKGGILEKYGGYEHLDAPPKELLLAQTEDYVEYSRSGKIVKGMDSQKIRSRYEEDVYINNHTSVWGSFWKDGQWGYKCCHSFVKNSYCTGEKGIALEQAGSVATGSMPPPLAIAGPSSSVVTISRKRDSDSEEEEEEDEDEKKKLVAGTSASAISQRERDEESLRKQREKRKRKKEAAKEKRKAKKEDKKRKKMKKKKESSSSSSSSSSSDSSDDDEDEEEKKKRLLKKALEQEDKRRKEADELLAMDERKRPYNSMFNVKQPTEEEMEAYFMKRGRDDDPMAKFV